MPPDGRILGLVLAGGGSRRMGGRDKAELELAGERLIERACRRLAPQVDRLIIAAPHAYGLPYEALADPPDGARGPSAALHGAMGWIDANPEARIMGIATVPVDGPFFPDDLVTRLAAAGSAAVAQAGGRLHATFAFWSRNALAGAGRLLDQPEGLALMRLADAVGAARVAFADGTAFLNINTPDDLARARAMLRRG